MTKIILSGIFILFIADAWAQNYKTVKLEPITYTGGKYYYNMKRVDVGAYGLQIPLQSLNDDEINRRYKTFRTMNGVSSILILAPVIYLYSAAYNTVGGASQLSTSTFWWVLGGTLAAQLTLQGIGRSHLRKGIDRYNTLILQPSGKSLGISMTYRF